MTTQFFNSLLTLAFSCLGFVFDAFAPFILFVAAVCVLGAAFSFIRFVITLRG